MIRSECDTCHALGEAPPPEGWLILSEIVGVSREGESPIAALLGSGGATSTETAGMFCGYACLGEYATAKALLDSAGSGEGPG